MLFFLLQLACPGDLFSFAGGREGGMEGGMTAGPPSSSPFVAQHWHLLIHGGHSSLASFSSL